MSPCIFYARLISFLMQKGYHQTTLSLSLPIVEPIVNTFSKRDAITT